MIPRLRIKLSEDPVIQKLFEALFWLRNHYEFSAYDRHAPNKKVLAKVDAVLDRHLPAGFQRHNSPEVTETDDDADPFAVKQVLRNQVVIMRMLAQLCPLSRVPPNHAVDLWERADETEAFLNQGKEFKQ